ncbi:hypothetical protein D9Q98_001543 [Chlorella vulgaris]|uniref:Photolyase/cryptochrome alpha/beta domain-containing protein n=1 Tax=Chlorella vulgaris TaxID=3077 RepID=A0A9D4Z2T3_CHLVU|nr:hypothetical protein D9Q98_001543 [Chlorella vulgaris]
MSKTSIIWFRKGLRLHDNPALLEAARGADHLCPIFILDPWFLKPDKIGVNRIQFLLESLADLDASFRARGSRLLVLRGQPQEVLPRLFKDWGATHLCFESDTEPYAKTRDAAVRQAAEEAGVEVHSPVSHTLYDPELLLSRSGGKPPLTMQSFTKLVTAVGPPPEPAADPPGKLPPLAPKAAKEAARDGGAAVAVPLLADLGYPPAGTTPFKGGETAALARMADYLSDKAWVCAFEKPKGNPAAFVRPATTVLSPYLKFGCLSPRLFHAKLLQIYAEVSGKHTQPPVSLRGQLLWREFFTLCGYAVPNFNRMEGNPLCKQIPWVDDPERLRAWEESQTGYPWIDAIMAQLRQQGWMHHLARHSVACFLTRGDLWCSWEAGQAVFDKYLVDGDWSVNAANWQWLSASAFFSQYFRVYSPITFGKQYDKNGDYIRHFLPVLKDMPAKYIYEPWTAPLSVQQEAGCVVGEHYPEPIVEHQAAMKENMARMKAAYAAAKEGGGAATPAPPSSGSAAAKRARKK